MTGPNVAAGKMYEDDATAKGPTMAIQGAGLGDLLTHGAPANVSHSWDRSYAVSHCLSRNDVMIETLLRLYRHSTRTITETNTTLSGWIASRLCSVNCWPVVPQSLRSLVTA